jgi:hypothetical protein
MTSGLSPYRISATRFFGVFLCGAIITLCFFLKKEETIPEASVKVLKTTESAALNASEEHDWRALMKANLNSKESKENQDYAVASSEISSFCNTLLPNSKGDGGRSHRGTAARTGSRGTVDLDRAECRLLVSRAAAEEVDRSRRPNSTHPSTYLEVPNFPLCNLPSRTSEFLPFGVTASSSAAGRTQRGSGRCRPRLRALLRRRRRRRRRRARRRRTRHRTAAVVRVLPEGPGPLGDSGVWRTGAGGGGL